MRQNILSEFSTHIKYLYAHINKINTVCKSTHLTCAVQWVLHNTQAVGGFPGVKTPSPPRASLFCRPPFQTSCKHTRWARLRLRLLLISAVSGSSSWSFLYSLCNYDNIYLFTLLQGPLGLLPCRALYVRLGHHEHGCIRRGWRAGPTSLRSCP